MSGSFLANPKCQKIMLSFVFKDIINYEITYSFVRSSGHPAVRMFLTEAPGKTYTRMRSSIDGPPAATRSAILKPACTG